MLRSPSPVSSVQSFSHLSQDVIPEEDEEREGQETDQTTNSTTEDGARRLRDVNLQLQEQIKYVSSEELRQAANLANLELDRALEACDAELVGIGPRITFDNFDEDQESRKRSDTWTRRHLEDQEKESNALIEKQAERIAFLEQTVAKLCLRVDQLEGELRQLSAVKNQVDQDEKTIDDSKPECEQQSDAKQDQDSGPVPFCERVLNGETSGPASASTASVDMAHMYTIVAHQRRQDGLPEEAIELLHKAAKLYEQHSDLDQLAGCHRSLAVIYERPPLLAADKALDHYRAAIKVQQDLVNREPQNNSLMLDFIKSIGRLADCLTKFGPLDLAETEYWRAIRHFDCFDSYELREVPDLDREKYSLEIRLRNALCSLLIRRGQRRDAELLLKQILLDAHQLTFESSSSSSMTTNCDLGNTQSSSSRNNIKPIWMLAEEHEVNHRYAAKVDFPTEGIRQWRHALELYPSLVAIVSNLALLYRMEGRKHAAEVLTGALQSKPPA